MQHFTRWGIDDAYPDELKWKAITMHEFGHVLADQLIGQINKSAFCPRYYTSDAMDKVKMIDRVFKASKKNGDIYALSGYSWTDSHEFFAEAFCAREMGETLPGPIEKMLIEVLGK